MDCVLGEHSQNEPEMDIHISEEQYNSKMNVLTDRLAYRKEERFLTNRVLGRISENMHYEIFKYLDSRDLLEVRITKLGGFQLTSNKLLRSRITNYLDIKPILHLNADRAENIHNLRVFFEQIGQNKIVFEEKFTHNTEFNLIGFIKFSKLIIYSNI